MHHRSIHFLYKQQVSQAHHDIYEIIGENLAYLIVIPEVILQQSRYDYIILLFCTSPLTL